MNALKDWLTHPTVVRSCQIVIGLMFAFSGLAKIGDLSAFAGDIHNFRIVPIATEHLLAISLPWIEVAAAMALVLNIRARSAAVLVTGLLVVFTLAVISAVARDLSIECGCFGKESASRVGLVKIAQNVGWLALATIGSLRPR